jgi:hypothetical protein
VNSILGGVPPVPDQMPDTPRNQLNNGRNCLVAGAPDKAVTGGECDPPNDKTNDVFIENRPIIDTLYVTSASHVLRAGQRMVAKGVAVGPPAFDEAPRHMAITTPAITHRYDLVEADPENPSQPALDENGDYKLFPSSIAEIDQSGRITTKRPGPSERHWALVLLSVGDKAASYPVAFDPRRSFVARPQQPQQPASPIRHAALTAAAALPVVGAATPQHLPPTTPPPQPPNPTVGKIESPPLPQLPNLPTANAAPINPPAPAPPPPPPPPPSGTALSLVVGPVGLNVPPPSSVVPPPAPPIQPAPPGGARREARQRQAASAKSEQGSSEGANGESQDGGGDSASSNSFTRHENGDRPAAAERRPYDWDRHPATRRDPERPAPSFSMVGQDQSSGAGQAVLYGGGLTLMALVLALGWNIVRPRPGDRRPPQPAPAWARRRRRY